MSVGEWTGVIGATIGVGGVAVAAMKMIARDVQRDTKQLQHNGGSHVADYAKDARDISQRTLDLLQQHMVESARKEGEQDARLTILERTK